jgi:hypothetical protein
LMLCKDGLGVGVRIRITLDCFKNGPVSYVSINHHSMTSVMFITNQGHELR